MKKDLLKNLFYLFFPIIIGSLVGFFISKYIDYSSLVKPPLAPPKILFPIAWTIIYLLLGVSYYLLHKNSTVSSKEKFIYYFQLVVNYLWSFIFFVFKFRLLAVLWIILLDVLVYYMVYLFYKKYKLSAYLNIIYLIWITFATYLTIGIYILN